jgi:hypothetical protein
MPGLHHELCRTDTERLDIVGACDIPVTFGKTREKLHREVGKSLMMAREQVIGEGLTP